MYQEKITKLSHRLNDLLNAYEQFGGELIPAHGQTNDEWKAEAMVCILDCNSFFSEMAKIDKSFSHFCIKETDKEIERYNVNSVDREDAEIYSMFAPFDGYFDIVNQLLSSAKRVDWLRKKYRPITTAKARAEGENGHFGSFRFILGPDNVPQNVTYDDVSLGITGLRLRFFYIVMNKCYYNRKNDISFDEIENYLGGAERDEQQIRKYASEVNKIVRKKLKIDKLIIPSGKNRPKCYKISKKS